MTLAARLLIALPAGLAVATYSDPGAYSDTFVATSVIGAFVYVVDGAWLSYRAISRRGLALGHTP